MILLSGKIVRDTLVEELKQTVARLSVQPKLVIVQVGNNPESTVYINQKKKLGEVLGVSVEHSMYDENISENDLLKNVEKLNIDTNVTGIIVQLPLPKHINSRHILDSISSIKDVDGLGSVQTGLLVTGNTQAFIPATARGIMLLFDYYNISLSGKHVVVVGRSDLVGKPVATLSLSRNATVTLCHSKTAHLKEITQTADVIIVAIGKPNFVDSSYVREGQVVIDVGIHKLDGAMCGDVNFESVKDIVSAISPVPGGVGPLTVVSLFQNLVDASQRTV
ncbi:MAG: bifunctional 5,10-methylenetetrahydrofolate dehydrogenase/5,10-methenyltetrahydrofolate cyclohydrolase [bacterium]